MSLASVVRKGVATANKVTKSLQPKITWSAWIGSDYQGKAKFASAKKLDAIIDQTVNSVRTESGEEVQTKAYVAVLSPIPDTSATKLRKNPIDERDQIVLPDGTTGKIVKTTGFVNKETGRPFFSEIWIG